VVVADNINSVFVGLLISYLEPMKKWRKPKIDFLSYSGKIKINRIFYGS